MFNVIATRPKSNQTPTTEQHGTHAAAVGAMVRLMKEFATVEITRASRIGFRQVNVR